MKTKNERKYVVIYGLLREGDNFNVIVNQNSDVRFIKNVIVNNYILIAINSFPFIVKKRGFKFKGEMYEVSDNVFDRIKRFYKKFNILEDRIINIDGKDVHIYPIKYSINGYGEYIKEQDWLVYKIKYLRKYKNKIKNINKDSIEMLKKKYNIRKI